LLFVVFLEGRAERIDETGLIDCEGLDVYKCECQMKKEHFKGGSDIPAMTFDNYEALALT